MSAQRLYRDRLRERGVSIHSLREHSTNLWGSLREHPTDLRAGCASTRPTYCGVYPRFTARRSSTSIVSRYSCSLMPSLAFARLAFTTSASLL